MRNRWLVAGAVAGALGWWGLHHRHRTHAPRTDSEIVSRVMFDLASWRGRLDWEVDRDGLDGVPDFGVRSRNVQQGHASYELAYGKASIETPSWRVSLRLDGVDEVVCERRFIHHPPPGFVMLSIEFRDGSGEDDLDADSLMRVWVETDREDELRALCTRYGLRMIGDFAVR
jgi:hypothetical protein